MSKTDWNDAEWLACLLLRIVIGWICWDPLCFFSPCRCRKGKWNCWFAIVSIFLICDFRRVFIQMFLGSGGQPTGESRHQPPGCDGSSQCSSDGGARGQQDGASQLLQHCPAPPPAPGPWWFSHCPAPLHSLPALCCLWAGLEGCIQSLWQPHWRLPFVR